jgi:hypothetical protein
MKFVPVARTIYELHAGVNPDGLSVVRNCATRGCLNPLHMALRSHKHTLAVWLRREYMEDRVVELRKKHG